MTKDDRPTLNLGHLAIPNVSASQEWLKQQGEQRQKSIDVVADAVKEWFGDTLPDGFYEQIAQRIVFRLDTEV